MLSPVLKAAILLAALLGPVSAMAQAPSSVSVSPLASNRTFYSSRVVPSFYVSGQEHELIARINQERADRGLNMLVFDPLLMQTARRHCWDMFARSYFDHTSPDAHRQGPMDRYLATLHASGQDTPSYLMVGENIYYCSEEEGQEDVPLAHHTFMASPEHRANILDSRYTRVGVGIYHDAQGEMWVTEMFTLSSD